MVHLIASHSEDARPGLGMCELVHKQTKGPSFSTASGDERKTSCRARRSRRVRGPRPKNFGQQRTFVHLDRGEFIGGELVITETPGARLTFSLPVLLPLASYSALDHLAEGTVAAAARRYFFGVLRFFGSEFLPAFDSLGLKRARIDRR